MRAALYVRVSTEEQTTANQLAEVQQLAERRGWEPVLYEETGSAAKARPVFERLLLDARAGKVGAVVVWALDRLHRSMFGMIADVRELTRLGVEIVSIREGWLDTGGPARDLLIAVFGWVAQYERERLIERTLAGIERARRQGTKSGKPIGRPRVSNMALTEGVRLVIGDGMTVVAAARKVGLGESTLRRAVVAAKTPGPATDGPA